jgi:DNA-binding CsgD family transcriptional regulator
LKDSREIITSLELGAQNANKKFLRGTFLRKLSFEGIAQSLLDAAVDPTRWTGAMDDIAQFSSSNSALLLKSKGRTPGSPHSRSAEGVLEVYFKEGWHLRDERERGLPLFRRKGSFVDQDFASEAELRSSDYYRGFLAKFDANWGLVVGFSTQDEEWCLVMTRGDGGGRYELAEQQKMVALAPVLNQAAALHRHLAHATNQEVLDVYEAIDSAAILVGASGRVLKANARAHRLLGDRDSGITMRHGALRCIHPSDQLHLQNLLSKLEQHTLLPSSGFSLVNRRHSKLPMIIRGTRIAGSLRNFFSRGTSLLLLNDLESPTTKSSAKYLRAVFGLSSLEAQVAELLETGFSLKEVSEKMDVSYETSRFHLKSIFSKTHITRQSDLIRLLNKVPRE